MAEVLDTVAQSHQRIGNTAQVAKLGQRIKEIDTSKQVAYGPMVKPIE